MKNKNFILTMKPTTCNNFSNLYIFFNKTLHVSDSSPVHHWQFFHCTDNDVLCHKGLLTACQQDQDGSVLILLASRMTYTTAVCIVKIKNADDGQENCPKHVEFYSKNKF